jgi:hypothetical protein
MKSGTFPVSRNPKSKLGKGIFSVPGKFECIGRRRRVWCTKAELSGR